MGILSRLTRRVRGLFRRSTAAPNTATSGHATDMRDIVHERAVREANVRRGDSGGNTPNSSAYF